MVRFFLRIHQNNRYFAQSLSRTIGTIRHIASFSVRSETNGKRTQKKPSRLPTNYTSYRKREQKSRSDSRIKKTSQLPRGSGPREARLAYMALSHLEMVLRGKPNFRFKFHTMASSEINRSACLSFTNDRWKASGHGPWRNQDGSGTTKSKDFCLRNSNPRSGTHILTRFAWRTDIAYTAQGACSAHVTSLHLTLSILMFHPPCSLTVTSRPPSRP